MKREGTFLNKPETSGKTSSISCGGGDDGGIESVRVGYFIKA